MTVRHRAVRLFPNETMNAAPPSGGHGMIVGHLLLEIAVLAKP